MKLSVLGLATTFALLGGSSASVLIDDFESYNDVGDDMDTKGGWIVTNGTPLNGGDGPVVIVDSYTWEDPTPSNRSATVGGVEQTTLGLTSLYHNTDTKLAGTIAVKSSFSFETSYTESTGGSPRNDFQFILTTSAGTGNLLTINLTPGAPGEYDIAWTSDFTGGGLITPLLGGANTKFQLDTWWNGSAMEYEFFSGVNLIATNIFSPLLVEGATLTRFEVNWDSSNGVGAGFTANSITIDNVSLVPEPSSALLGLLGATLAFTRRRRA